MLSLLHIENIAVIELADIAFDGRLNVLTGETGAGKSIVIDAFSALLGQRTSRDLIRSGCEAAGVRGVFENPELMLERELREDGRNLCRADQKPITLSALREYGDALCNIHGQHDSQALLREETHIGYLDAFAGISTDVYRVAYDKWKELDEERKRLTIAEDEKRSRVDLLTHRLRELREADPSPGEEEALAARRKTLRNAERIREALNTAYFSLYGDEDERGSCELCETAGDSLADAARNAPELEPLAERLRDLQYSLRDCADETRSLIEGMEESEAELEQLEARLDTLNRLRRKHNLSIAELLAAGERWEEELESLETADRRLSVLDGELKQALAVVLAEADKLTVMRREASRSLAEKIAVELEDLDMGKVRFSVEREQTEPGPSGRDSIRFTAATNVGEPFKPLAKVASGGEMARIMLALKNLVTDSVPTLVFDEVDSGVSGRAAQRIAQKLCSVSRKKQVLCVTHLPQIAAMADTHFHVEKAVENGRTVTRVIKLDRTGRIEELACIMAGASVTDTTRQTAEELLLQAEAFKERL